MSHPLALSHYSVLRQSLRPAMFPGWIEDRLAALSRRESAWRCLEASSHLLPTSWRCPVADRVHGGLVPEGQPLICQAM